jgi:hypothetical protein
MTLPNDLVVTYRAMLPAPPDVRLDEIGAVCPVDDTVLTVGLRGWCCPTCLAWWDLRGRCGMWLTDDRALAAEVAGEDVDPMVFDGQLVDEHDESARLRRLDRRCALAVAVATVCGVGYSVGWLSRPWAHLVPDSVVWAVAVGLVAVTVAGLGAAAWRWWAGWWPYRHNRVLGTVSELGWDTSDEFGRPGDAR